MTSRLLEQSEVEAFELSAALARLRLSQYEQCLRQNGFEDWETVTAITEADMAALNFKRGDRRKLQHAIREYSTLRASGREHRTGHLSLPSGGSISSGEHAEVEPKSSQQTARTTRPYRRHPRPDLNSPQKPKTAYMLFGEHIRQDLTLSHLSFTDIAKETGKRWRALSDEERLKTWETPADHRLSRYKEELERYKETEEYQNYQMYLKKFKQQQHHSEPMRPSDNEFSSTQRIPDSNQPPGSDFGDTEARAIRQRYQQLKERRTAQDELYEMMQTMSETDAAEIFHRVRSGATADAIVRHVNEGNLVLELSVVPPRLTRFQFPYITSVPPKLHGSRYFCSHVFHAVQAVDWPSPADKLNLIARQSNYTTPFFAAEIADPLLSKAKPSIWTRVSSNDVLLRKLLEAYFMFEYPWEYIFQKDYFLEDMIYGANKYCSSLLVNAVLAKACTCSRSLPKRANFWDPNTLTYRFLAEAKRLWELEQEKPSLTTVQAGCLINAAMNMSGHDKPGIAFSLKSFSMAKKMGIFNGCSAGDLKYDNAVAFTAWGLFSFLSLQSYYFFQPPYILGSLPWVLPSVEKNGEWYSEVWLRYPSDETLYPMGFGYNMKALSELRLIMRDICAISFCVDQPAPKMSWEQALAFHTRLIDWFETLPAALSYQTLLYPSHIKLHCEYYSTIIMLFNTQLSFLTSDDSDVSRNQCRVAETITTNATLELESLLRIYYLRHGFETFDALLLTHLVHLSNVVLQRLAHITQHGLSTDEVETLRSTLILCLKGLYDQSRNFRMSGIVFGAMKSQLSAELQNLLGRFVTMKDPDIDEEAISRAEPVLSEYVIPVVHLNEDPGPGRVANMI